MELSERTVLVTGATGGLGQTLCRRLADRGARIGIAFHADGEGAEALAAELRSRGGKAEPLRADLTDAAEAAALVDELARKLGPPTDLVLNSAANQWIPFEDLEALTPERWRSLLDQNLTAHYLLARAASPFLKEASGAIVAVASEVAFKPAGSSIAYAVAKAGLVHLTQCLAVALAPRVRVNAVAPGFMEETKMSSKLDPDRIEAIIDSRLLKRSADKGDVADAVLMLLSNESVTGQTLVVDAGSVFH